MRMNEEEHCPWRQSKKNTVEQRKFNKSMNTQRKRASVFHDMEETGETLHVKKPKDAG